MDPYLTIRLTDSGSGRERMITTRLTGTYNLENILAAWTAGSYFHVDSENMARAIAGYQPANMRSQVLETGHNRVILDAYNANPSSMEAALKDFAGLSDPDKWIIMGDMLELGHGSAGEHQRIVDLAIQLGLLNGILIGEHFASLRVPAGFRVFRDITETREYLSKHPIRRKTLLVKGSRVMGLEKLTDLF
jgi:UDP-N-acetylmuramoyl-tripeptide--D-alanyl-D-alanine ligase